jgi:futalosine hydrolase
MRILAAAATAMEVAPLVSRFDERLSAPSRMTRYAHRGHEVDVLVTGVGMVATAAWCSRTLAETRYDGALNVGVCGSFDASIALGSVVHVVSDRVAELGAEGADRFLTVEDLQLLESSGEPFTRARLVNETPLSSAALAALPRVDGITVNTVHGRDASIAAVRARFAPQVESMEGAAFMYACLIHGIRFAQVRAVSNIVEKRNRAAWQMPPALENLARAACAVIETL